MTELIDLITDPKARLTKVMDAFIQRIEDEHKQRERNLDHVYERYRTKLHRQHMKTVHSYKSILDAMFIETKQNIEPDAIEFFERFLRAEDRDPWKHIIRESLPVLNKVEKEGGRIDMSIKHYDSTKISSGDCLFSEHPDGHFSFLDEFLDGFDDYYEFKVMKMHKDEKKKKEEDEAFLEQHRAKWRAKLGPANEVVLLEAKTLANELPDLLKENSVVPE
jgi:23S rRNA pseudoU1915 N3-methylase RlmH